MKGALQAALTASKEFGDELKAELVTARILLNQPAMLTAFLNS